MNTASETPSLIHDYGNPPPFNLIDDIKLLIAQWHDFQDQETERRREVGEPAYNQYTFRLTNLTPVTKAIQILQPEMDQKSAFKQANQFIQQAFQVTARETTARLRVFKYLGAAVLAAGMVGLGSTIFQCLSKGVNITMMDLVLTSIKLAASRFAANAGMIGTLWAARNQHGLSHQVDTSNGYVVNPKAPDVKDHYKSAQENVHALLRKAGVPIPTNG